MSMSVALIIIVVFLYASLGTYVFIRGSKALPKKKMLCILYRVAFMITSLCFIVGITLAQTLPMSLSILCKSIGGCWAFSLVLFAGAALLADLLGKIKQRVPIIEACLTHHGRQIRNIYLASVILAVSVTILYGYSCFIHPQMVTLNLEVDKPTALQREFTIIAASDMHLGGVSGIKRLASWVNLINRQQPDIIVFAGDLIDRDFNYRYAGDYIKELKKLKARYGVYSILGNHEHYQDPKLAFALLKHSGIQLLCNRAITIDSSMVLIGRDDGTNTPRKPLETVMTGLDRKLPIVLLDHQPTLGEAELNKVDLQISGHLHNGQIFPFNLILEQLWPLSYGYGESADTRFYVTSGLGLRFIPLRLGTQSEIVIIQLNTEHNQSHFKDGNN